MKVLVGADAVEEELAGHELVLEPADDVEAAVVGDALAAEAGRLLPRLPGLRLVQALFAGIEWLLPVVPGGVTVCSARGVHDGPVAEWVVAVILAQERGLSRFADLQRARRWSRAEEGRDLAGRCVLIVGHGSIGHAVEARLRPFGARVVGVTRRNRADLHRLVGAADVVVLLVPLTAETEHLVDERFLACMRRGALLVNAARGRVVDTEALVAALESERIRAALDVTDPEPLPADHPLWASPGLLLTPHVAGAVAGWRTRAYRFAAEQLRRYGAGEPLLNVERRA